MIVKNTNMVPSFRLLSYELSLSKKENLERINKQTSKQKDTVIECYQGHVH